MCHKVAATCEWEGGQGCVRTSVFQNECRIRRGILRHTFPILVLVQPTKQQTHTNHIMSTRSALLAVRCLFRNEPGEARAGGDQMDIPVEIPQVAAMNHHDEKPTSTRALGGQEICLLRE